MLNVADAVVEWRDGVPRHPIYDDHYFSSHDGLAETRYIFLQCNGLPERWHTVNQFVVGEIGFGTGLNFLATVDLWLRNSPPGAILHYLSVDKYIVRPDDVRRTLIPWPELNSLAEHWLNVFPDAVSGLHRRELWGGRVILTLAYGDGVQQLSGVCATVDAWYLDGFAPERNPELWSERLVAQVARLSRPGTTLASFTVAGFVRRCLSNFGFTLHKVPGFGKKREMLTGKFSGPRIGSEVTPWYQYAEPALPKDAPVMVIGGGIAGVTAAWQLARRGHRVRLLEAGASIAAEASGNPAGLVLPRLASDAGRDTRFYLAAFLYAVHWFNTGARNLGQSHWHGAGLIQLMTDAQAQALRSLGLPDSLLRVLDRDAASHLAGIGLASGGVLHGAGGWLNPQAWCRQLLQDQAPAIDISLNVRIQTLVRENGHWSADSLSGERYTAPIVILANGMGAHQFMPKQFTRLSASRGQVSYLPKTSMHGKLAMPVCGKGYISPTEESYYLVGASYDSGNLSTGVRQADHDFNWEQLRGLIPGNIDIPPQWQGRAAVRATTLDHLPLIGPVPDWVAWRHNYRDLCHGKPAGAYPIAEYQPGLFASIGHGSRGLMTSPLAGALLADYIHGNPLCLPHDLAAAVHPGRFMVRAAKQGTLLQSRSDDGTVE